jgi:hypothetical protein
MRPVSLDIARQGFSSRRSCITIRPTLVNGSPPVTLPIAAGVQLLGIPRRQVGHIKMADGVLGSAGSFEHYSGS